nr:MAG TPA: holin [Caudoviricetes sp.]
MTEITVIPALAAIVYTIIDIAKTAMGGTEKFNRFIPLIACVLGAVCGVVAFYFVPGTMGTENILVAIVLGAASGLSATGTNQAVKQLTKPAAKEVTDNESA